MEGIITLAVLLILISIVYFFLSGDELVYTYLHYENIFVPIRGTKKYCIAVVTIRRNKYFKSYSYDVKKTYFGYNKNYDGQYINEWVIKYAVRELKTLANVACEELNSKKKVEDIEEYLRKTIKLQTK